MDDSKFSLPYFMRIYMDVLDQKNCKNILKILKKSKKWEKHEYYNVVTKELTTYKDDLDVHENLFDEGKIIQNKVLEVVKDYITSIGNPRYFNSIQDCSDIRYNRYSKNQIMRHHCDHIHSLFDGQRKGIPILSVVGGLNDNYKGGEFVMFEDLVFKIPAGSVLIFPSNFMYPHAVKPVTSGQRFSYVSWIW